MNGFSHQYVHAEKLRKAGKSFKAIHGVEAYFVPSLVHWKELYEAQKASGVLSPKKTKGKAPEASEEAMNGILEAGDELSGTKEELDEVTEAKKAEKTWMTRVVQLLKTRKNPKEQQASTKIHSIKETTWFCWLRTMLD